jgi:hypothetical protein
MERSRRLRSFYVLEIIDPNDVSTREQLDFVHLLMDE